MDDLGGVSHDDESNSYTGHDRRGATDGAKVSSDAMKDADMSAVAQVEETKSAIEIVLKNKAEFLEAKEDPSDAAIDEEHMDSVKVLRKHKRAPYTANIRRSKRHKQEVLLTVDNGEVVNETQLLDSQEDKKEIQLVPWVEVENGNDSSESSDDAYSSEDEIKNDYVDILNKLEGSKNTKMTCIDCCMEVENMAGLNEESKRQCVKKARKLGCVSDLAAVKTWQQILNKEFGTKKSKEDVGGSSYIRRKGKRNIL
ncbi:hypothetical protein Tco_1310423 [Tanacetum coccineum]